MSVFFNSGMSLDETASDLQRLLFIDLKREVEEGLSRYRHTGLGYAMTLLADHGLVDDQEIHFSRYRYQCAVDVVEEGVRRDTSAALRRDIAMCLFDKIIHDRRWPAMVVFNLEDLVESFEPRL